MTDIIGLAERLNGIDVHDYGVGAADIAEEAAAVLTAQSKALEEWKNLAEGLMGYAEHKSGCRFGKKIGYATTLGCYGAPVPVIYTCTCGLSALTARVEEMANG